jgi:hypothetical protein
MNSKKLVMHRFLKGYEIEVRIDIRDLEALKAINQTGSSPESPIGI